VTLRVQVRALSQFGDLPLGVDLIVMRQEPPVSADAVVALAGGAGGGHSTSVPAAVAAAAAALAPVPISAAHTSAPAPAPAPAPLHVPSQLSSVLPAAALAALQSATSDESYAAIAYYDDVEFAVQLCSEFADEEGANYSVSVPLQEACITLQRNLASKPQAVINRVQLASALADAEAIVKLRDSGSGHEQQLQNELSAKEQLLRDELSGVQKACDPNPVLQKLQLDEAQARSVAANDVSLLEQQLGTDALRVNEMKEEESLSLATKDFKKGQEANSRLKTYVADCAQRVQAATSQRRLQLEQQLLQLRMAAKDTNAAAEKRVAAMQLSFDAALIDHRSQLQQLRTTISSLIALAPRAQALLNRQPAWPRHEALLRFGLPLHLLERHWFVSKKWFPRFFILRGRRVYYSDGRKEQADSHEGSLAFMRSKPAPDGRYCIDLKGAHARCVTAVQRICFTHMYRLQCHVLQRTRRRAGVRVRDQVPSRGQGASVCAHSCVLMSHAILQAPNDVCLASADDATRQRCVRIMQAAASASVSSSLQDIASAVALTRDLIGIKSLPAVNAVLAGLGKAAAKGLDVKSLIEAGFDVKELQTAGFNLAAFKAAGFDSTSLKAAGFDAAALKVAGFDSIALKASGFGLTALKAAGYDAAALKAACFGAYALKAAGFDLAALKAAGFSAADLKTAGFDLTALKAAGFDAAALKAAGFDLIALKASGFGLNTLKAAGYNATALKAAGFDMDVLKAAGFNAQALKAAGF